jgi:two-component system, OmpR family, KDP operon response regulator KdpE
MSKKTRILVVDDEISIRRFLNTSLSVHGYEVFEVATGEEALFSIRQNKFGLLIVDLGLPAMNGIELTRKVREFSAIPIIVISVIENEKEKVSALDAGADDYLTKPFGMEELLARIRVALRHSGQPTDLQIVAMGEIKVDFSLGIVSKNGVEIPLTPTEYDLLRVLIQSSGKVITHTQLIQKLWGDLYQMDNHILRVNISNLRKKLEKDPTQPEFILTDPGVGYRFKLD